MTAATLRQCWRKWLRREKALPPPMPVVVGVARSGTTLLRLMLDAHPEVAIPAETHFLPVVGQLRETDAALRQAFFRTVTEFPTWEDFNVPKDTFWEALTQVEPFTAAEGCRCFYRLYAGRCGKLRWGDKSPPYGLYLDTIQALLPEAHFLHIVRDGRDVAVSLRGLWFSPGDDMTTLARHWCNTIRRTRAMAQGCRHYLEIRYEDLLTAPRRELIRICRFLKLEFDERMEHYHEGARQRLDEVQTRRREDGAVLITKEERLFLHRWTSHPPEPSRSGRWRSELSAAECAGFEAEAGDLLREYGYPVRSAA